ncbi:MAG: 50S ribosome-binding GTPase, partial [Candidatus Methanomethylophilus sp.]|nr:50S ribosome-binding GTPase [Methanomethylophilus sp.]
MGFTIALAGNPNCGKTTLFNKLTGASQRVGNWPGVTIDRKTGKIRGMTDAELVDTPGIYSLSPYSPEEVVTRNFLLEGNPDAVINIVDATNIERNLFLTLQILDTGIPTVVALNMMDTIEKEGGSVDAKALSEKLGCPVIPISALKSEGLKELVDAAATAANECARP